MEPKPKTRDVYALVTNRIIEHLEQGTVPWKRPWTNAGVPRNLLTGRLYRGVNVWLLNALNYEQNVFLTSNQVQEIGGNIRAGEHAHLVVLWKWVHENSANVIGNCAQNRKIPLLRYYNVFNIAQCSNIPDWYLPMEKPSNEPIGVCEEIFEWMPNAPGIRHMGDEAYYHPFFDFVNMPAMDRFINSETYYATLFHELIHSTGHKGRLSRKEFDTFLPNTFDKYSLEELTAEIGACYLNSYAGIDGWDFQNHIAYIQNWLEKLRNDKRLIVYASAQAQRAVDYILNPKEQHTEESEGIVLQTIAL